MLIILSILCVMWNPSLMLLTLSSGSCSRGCVLCIFARMCSTACKGVGRFSMPISITERCL